MMFVDEFLVFFFLYFLLQYFECRIDFLLEIYHLLALRDISDVSIRCPDVEEGWTLDRMTETGATQQ